MSILQEPLSYTPVPGEAAVFSAGAAVVPSRFYTLNSPETTLASILERLENTVNMALVRVEQTDKRPVPHRLFLQMHFNTGAADGSTGGEDVYGVLEANLNGKPAVQLLKLFSRTVTLTTGSGATVGGGAYGGGNASGGQFPEQATTVTTTGVLEALTGGTIEPLAVSDGRMSGVSLADIGPFIGLLRCPYGTAGVVLLHNRWK